jgi:probable rRNA maturation factor
MIRIELSNQQARHPVDEKRLLRAVRRILKDEGIRHGSISLAVVDDPTIHALNRRHLKHDYPTDVLSFVFAAEPGRLEGEVIVSADTAAACCRRFGWTADDELLLYVIHGMLHLVGCDDTRPSMRRAMRQRERHYLELFQLAVRYDADD